MDKKHQIHQKSTRNGNLVIFGEFGTKCTKKHQIYRTCEKKAPKKNMHQKSTKFTKNEFLFCL